MVFFFVFNFFFNITFVTDKKKKLQNAKIFLGELYLNNGNPEEVATQANDDGRGSHDGRAGEESDGHGEGGDGVATCNYLGLESHKQPCPHQNRPTKKWINITISQ